VLFTGNHSAYVSKWFAYKYFDFISDKNTVRKTSSSTKEKEEEKLNFISEVSNFIGMVLYYSIYSNIMGRDM